MPAPVRSRRALTSLAEMVTSVTSWLPRSSSAGPWGRRWSRRAARRPAAGLDRLGDLGLGLLARLALAAGDQGLLALALGLLGGLLAGLLLGLLAGALLGLTARLLLGLLARALLLGAERVLALADDV